MSTMTLLLKLTRFVDSEGVEHWLEVRPEVMDLLGKVEPPLKERLLRRPENLVKVADRWAGNPWEGPRLRFSWLVGESRTWAGEPVVEVNGERYCTICWDRWLPGWAYCLGCDRSGRDREIPTAATGQSRAGRKGPARFRPKGA
jgi:hypothetical protein